MIMEMFKNAAGIDDDLQDVRFFSISEILVEITIYPGMCILHHLHLPQIK